MKNVNNEIREKIDKRAIDIKHILEIKVGALHFEKIRKDILSYIFDEITDLSCSERVLMSTMSRVMRRLFEEK